MTEESARPPIDAVTDVLARAKAPGAFATRRVVDGKGLSIGVTGVGPIPLPVPPAVARRLCEVARPARYGRGTETLLDRRVRDAWEVGKAQLVIDGRRWRPIVDAQLESIARELGVPAGCRVRAELHNLLVYGPGQHFATHQDSEKADGMFGTLVVLLPSTARGGALTIEHHDERVSYRGSAQRITLVAFYADCHHQVTRVTAGYRVALTCNLFLDGMTARPPAAAGVELLADRVREYFDRPRRQRWSFAPSEGPPERLIYLLDHQYTQKGLGWETLKNGDATRAALLRAVAERLDCEIVLALADVHEIWNCEDEGYDRRSWRYRDDDDDDAADGGGEPGLLDLADSNIELRHWLTSTGKRRRPIGGRIDEDEVCYTKATVELEPFASEHEGYTGNAGNTVERWYHRAAVMLWPRARAFAIRARAEPAWAIGEIGKRLHRRDLAEARAMAGQLRPFWSRAARVADRALTDATLEVAVGLEDAALAGALLEPLTLEQVTAATALRWAALLAEYGLAWCRDVLRRWGARPSHDPAPRLAWLATLPAFGRALCARGPADARELLGEVGRSEWESVAKDLRALVASMPTTVARRGLQARSRAIVALLAAAAMADDRELGRTIVASLTVAAGYPIECAVDVLRVADGYRPAAERAGLGLAPLQLDAMLALQRRLAAPVRDPDDWSITAPAGCACAVCKELSRFLIARDRREHVWPLATSGREHVHHIIAGRELPVTHLTRRTGSPYHLVLTKTPAIFAAAAAARQAAAEDLAWLTNNARSRR